jgi:hypothetical protein
MSNWIDKVRAALDTSTSMGFSHMNLKSRGLFRAITTSTSEHVFDWASDDALMISRLRTNDYINFGEALSIA